MATGHYVQKIVNSKDKSELHKAVDHGKDQSYFLFATTQEQLDFLQSNRIVDNIITNPPFKLALDFVLKAKSICNNP
jgi:hypothetical protein